MNVVGWAESHKWEAGGIVFVGLVALLWLFGFFRSSSSSAGTANNAGAYYAAEATQTQASTALAIAQTQADAATAQNQSNNDALMAINAANNTTSQVNSAGYFNMNTTEALSGDATQVALGAQTMQTQLGLGAQATQVSLGAQARDIALGNQQLQATATQSNNALAANNVNTAAQVTAAQIQATGQAYHEYATTIVPQEIAQGYKGAGFAPVSATPTTVAVGGFPANPALPAAPAPVKAPAPKPPPQQYWHPIFIKAQPVAQSPVLSGRR
jgi:hypothetical protein